MLVNITNQNGVEMTMVRKNNENGQAVLRITVRDDRKVVIFDMDREDFAGFIKAAELLTY